MGRVKWFHLRQYRINADAVILIETIRNLGYWRPSVNITMATGQVLEFVDVCPDEIEKLNLQFPTIEERYD